MIIKKDMVKEEIKVHSDKDLQKQLIILVESNNKLVTRIDKLVSLFEEASKHVGEVESTEARVNELAGKLESLLDQNKTIAQGLLLLEKYVRGKTRVGGEPQPSMNFQ